MAKACVIILLFMFAGGATYGLYGIPDDMDDNIIQKFYKVYTIVKVIELAFVWLIAITGTILLIRS